jgi:prevent-host-death family protein
MVKRGTMVEVPISVFKAKCLALLEEVRRTRKPIRITRHGKPVAEVVPSEPVMDRAKWLESIKGSVTIVGDIVSPANDPDDWEVNRD